MRIWSWAVVLVLSVGAHAAAQPAPAPPVDRAILLRNEADFRKVLAGNPRDEETRSALVYTLLGLGRDEDAEQVVLEGLRQGRTGTLLGALASVYSTQGKFDRAIAALQEFADLEPSNPLAPFAIATYYWDRAYRQRDLLGAQTQRSLIADGRAAIERALALKPDYYEAIVYKGLLIRLEAALEPVPERQKALLAEAEQLRDRAAEIKRRLDTAGAKAAARGGVTGPIQAAPPPPPAPPKSDAALQPRRVGGEISPPKKIYNVEPIIPQIAISARVQGIVIVEAVIDVEGRVTDIKVLRSIPLLDQAVIDAVRQWRYEPTLVKGVPTPVIVTATVKVTLQ